MKKIVSSLACGLLIASNAFSDVTLTQIVTRQLWPWSTNIEIAFTAGGVEDVVKMSVKAYDGETLLGTVPASAMWGDTYVDANGLKKITIDPTTVDFLSEKGALANFRVTLEAASTASDPILYLVFDMSKQPGEQGQKTFITQSELQSGAWGKCDADRDWGANLGPIWRLDTLTGTPKDEYRSRKIIFRRIPAGTFTMGSPTDEIGRFSGKDSYGEETQHSVTISKPFWIGALELTKAQNIWCDDTTGAPAVTGDDYKPQVSFSNRDALLACVAKFGPRLGLGSRVKLPTEAQWEYACRAGSTKMSFAGHKDFASLSEMASWFNGCAVFYGNPYFTSYRGAWQALNGTSCNAWGLFDILGNAWEATRDAYVADLGSSAVTDPCAEWTSSSEAMVFRGSSGWEAINPDGFCRCAIRRKVLLIYVNNNTHGLRLCIE